MEGGGRGQGEAAGEAMGNEDEEIATREMEREKRRAGRQGRGSETQTEEIGNAAG